MIYHLHNGSNGEMNSNIMHKRILETVQDKLTCSAHNLDKLYTKKAREIGNERIKYMEEFFNKLKIDMEGIE